MFIKIVSPVHKCSHDVFYILPFSSDSFVSLLPNTGIGADSSLGLVTRGQLQKFTNTGVQFDDYTKEKSDVL